MRSFGLALSMALLVAACGDNSPGKEKPDASPVDEDGDGWSLADGDCDDSDPAINPGAPDPCDGKDNNCNGRIDEAYDADGDNVSICQGDCNDNDPTVFPGARELIDGRDNDCDGIVDNHNDQYDDDGDGYTEDQGDCDDDEPFVNPGAIEVQLDENGEPENVDNDCDGFVDEAPVTCDESLDSDNADDYARALDICERVSSARFEAPTDPRARRIVSDWGSTYVPQRESSMFVLATGIAADEDDPGYVVPQSGTDLGSTNTHAHPAPGLPAGCGDPDPSTVNDYAEVRFELQVPTNAQSFSFDFNFMSTEYPEFVCTQFDDTFLVLLDSRAFTGNISFDSMGNPISINVAFFTICAPGSEPMGIPPGTCTGDADLMGTGYDGSLGGGTGWLTTTSPVEPGEKITLRFIIFDEGDHILDSAVLVDNFRWHLEPVSGPVTERRLPSVDMDTEARKH